MDLRFADVEDGAIVSHFAQHVYLKVTASIVEEQENVVQIVEKIAACPFSPVTKIVPSLIVNALEFAIFV